MAFRPTIQNISAIKTVLNNNIAVQDIADQLNCSLKTVYNWKNKIQDCERDHQEIYDRRRNNSAILKINNDEIAEVVQTLYENPSQSVKHIPELLNLNVHEKTLRRNIKKRTGFRYRKPANKIELTLLNKERRLQYARDHIILTDKQ